MATIPTITVDMSLGLLKRKVQSLRRKGRSLALSYQNLSFGHKMIELVMKS